MVLRERERERWREWYNTWLRNSKKERNQYKDGVRGTNSVTRPTYSWATLRDGLTG